MICTGKYRSPLGEITLAGTGEFLTGLWFQGQKYYGAGIAGKSREQEIPVFKDVRRWLDLYFAGKDPGFVPALKPEGTPFRQEVWKILLEIPYGQVTTYGELSRKMAARKGLKSMSAQAVGGAVGHNPISLLIPCHRVIGTNGSMTGYAGGIDKKEALLKLEKAGKQLQEKHAPAQ